VRVLIVDDERMARESLQVLLKACNFHADIASNYEEALAIAANNPPEVTIIDWLLTDKRDGLTVAHAIRALCPDTHIIMTSGNTNLQQHIPSHPAFSFLAKPYQLPALLSILNSNG
jgi:DNA-binding response OmpR family regulator